MNIRKRKLPESWYTPAAVLDAAGNVSIPDLDTDFDDRYEAGQGVLIPVASTEGRILSERKQKAILRHFLADFSRTRFDLMIGVLRRDPEETITPYRRTSSSSFPRIISGSERTST